MCKLAKLLPFKIHLHSFKHALSLKTSTTDKQYITTNYGKAILTLPLVILVVLYSFIHSFVLIQAARPIKAHRQKIKNTTHNTRRQRNTKHSDKLYSIYASTTVRMVLDAL